MKLNAFVILILLCFHAAASSPVQTINYKVSANMRGEGGDVVATSNDVLEKIDAAFLVWEEASQGLLSFSFAGLGKASYDSRAQLPYDGAIHIVLSGRYNFHGEVGNGKNRGTIPENFKRGSVFMSKAGSAIRQRIFVHEIGHVLGLSHTATNTSVMFRGWPANERDEVQQLVEQDEADLRALWGPTSSGVFTIGGTVSTIHQHRMAFVLAVNVVNGHTYSARSDHMGRFKIALLQAGDYYLVGKAMEESDDIPAMAQQRWIPQRASWYQTNGKSTKTYKDATVLTLDHEHQHLGNFELQMIDEPAPFKLTRTETENPAKLVNLVPGDVVDIEFPQLRGLVSVQSFGRDPDYAFSSITGDRRFTLSIAERATPGERLVVARDGSGSSHIGLIGIHIVEGGRQ